MVCPISFNVQTYPFLVLHLNLSVLDHTTTVNITSATTISAMINHKSTTTIREDHQKIRSRLV
ncbi:hypothetical protein CDL12_15018 [Handroanthus impetiginosus]|uniref:Uncharacterized protein n=1 Tax=Handroanthus impetiginosus TaxID=429701 RepID=A0A2G9H4D0_9LAMI|nr:hypothetical protein CDL12_15018 [Handroanthus impetiginosus]